MTMNLTNLLSSRMIAAVFALALSATMVFSAVGPAVNVAGTSVVQGYIA